jgi:cytochrome c553
MMRSMKNLAGILPAIALAACLDQVPESGPTGPMEVAAVASARGAIIAQSMCASCHGATYQGGVMEGVECPSLAVVRNYSLVEFDALLRAGTERNGGSTNGYMTITHELSPTDRADVHQYFKTYYDQ